VWVFPQRADMGLPGLDERTYRLLIVMQMAIHHTLARDVMGADCLPEQACFSWPRGDADGAAAQGFGCALAFERPRNELRYARRWLDRQPQMADTLSAMQASRACARLVDSLVGSRSTSHRVYNELMRAPGQFPGIEAVAERLHMTGRTLRRHLQVEGTSYAELLTRVRQALAEDYLRTTRMSIEDIASALSYGDARTFRHAFVRWTGQPPSDFRRAA
jgi:AraC-like DNA-binding protein